MGGALLVALLHGQRAMHWDQRVAQYAEAWLAGETPAVRGRGRMSVFHAQKNRGRVIVIVCE